MDPISAALETESLLLMLSHLLLFNTMLIHVFCFGFVGRGIGVT